MNDFTDENKLLKASKGNLIILYYINQDSRICFLLNIEREHQSTIVKTDVLK